MDNFDQYVGCHIFRIVLGFIIRCFGELLEKVEAFISELIQDRIPSHMKQIGFGMGDSDTVPAVPQFQEHLLDDVLRCIPIFSIQVDKTKQRVVIGIIQPVKRIYVNMGTHSFSSVNDCQPEYRNTDIPELRS